MPSSTTPLTVHALIGVPASGKTTIFRKLIEALGPEQCDAFKYGGVRGYKWPGHAPLYVLGVYDGEYYDGTDRLTMNVAPDVRGLFRTLERGHVLFEGDRLSAQSVLEAAPRLNVYMVDPPEDVMEDRYAERAKQGRTQDASWLKGRKTKVQNLADEYEVERLPWDDPALAAAQLLEATERPEVAERLRKGGAPAEH